MNDSNTALEDAPHMVAVHEVDPTEIELHQYATLLPVMSWWEYGRLRDAIAIDGQLVPAVIYNGRLLDGRNRCEVCRELGIRLRVTDFAGTDEDALAYVLNVNQYHRELTKSQRAAVAVELIPYISEDVNRRRIEKIRAARQRAKQAEGETWTLMSGSPNEADAAARARDIAAQIMGVSGTYVQMALRGKGEAPDLFRKIWQGQVTVTAAMRQLDNPMPAEAAARVGSLRRRLNAILADLDAHPDFLERFAAFLDTFTPPPRA